MMQIDRNVWDDRPDGFFPQASSQWDGFRHVRCRELGFFTGVTEDPADMGDRLSIHHWADQGIVGRGILLDVERFIARTDPSDVKGSVSYGLPRRRRARGRSGLHPFRWAVCPSGGHARGGGQRLYERDARLRLFAGADRSAVHR